MYGDLAAWFHLLTAPEDYAGEAARYQALILDEVPEARTLLELGSGGGNNASHLKESFTCTLADVSPQMLTLSRELNPDCEHVLGDMRTLRLGRTFDVVFVHEHMAERLAAAEAHRARRRAAGERADTRRSGRRHHRILITLALTLHPTRKGTPA